MKIERITAQPEYGLTEEQVRTRIQQNLVNYDTTIPTKTIGQIIWTNLATPFNCLNIFLALAVFLVGSYKNLLFMGVVISNSIISIIQEIRSKKIIDRLSVLASKKVTVVREGLKQHIEINEIVLDDVLVYETGNQIITDGTILDGECEVSEAFITGESEAITKKIGDTILSSSFIMSGKCSVRVEQIGLENYAAKITHDAKYIKKVRSEIMSVINRIVKIISCMIIPVGCLLFYRQFSIPGNGIKDAIVHTVAALIVMIPEGLVLLTSMVFAVSIIRLAKHKVLVQELYCMEMLARTDVICLDKTGTITEGCMEVVDLIPYQQLEKETIENILADFSNNITDHNATIEAIRCQYQKGNHWKCDFFIPFSSKRKWSAVHFEKEGSYILGAPEIILKNIEPDLKERINFYSEEHRVLGLFHSKQIVTKEALPNTLELISLLFIKDKIRKEAKQTLEYFKKQGVAVKIISGDHVHTLSNIAKTLNLDHSDAYIDASKLHDQELEEAASQYSIFGRVSPEQKKKLILALKKQNHTVAMIGDGVNDVLALKEADCSIAVASGSDGARNVAQLVLLESNFDAMPKVVEEGRRSINNIERSSSLFLTKTIYATLMAILFLFIHLPYPFEPIQLTLISVVTIGIPSFVLALEPNYERIKGRFFENILRNSVPTAFTVLFQIIILSSLLALHIFSAKEISTLAVFLTAYTGILLLYKLCVPFDWMRRLLWLGMIFLFCIQFCFFKNFYSLTSFNLRMIIIGTSLFILGTALFYFLEKWIAKQLIHSKLVKRIIKTK